MKTLTGPTGGVVTTDTYTDANTVSQLGTIRVRIQVFNAQIAWRFAGPSYGTDQEWRAEEPLGPGLYSFDHECSAAQVRSLVAGMPALAAVTLLTRDDVGHG